MQDADGGGVLAGRHSELLGDGLGVCGRVDLPDLGDGHERHGVGVDTEHDLLLGKDGCPGLRRVYTQHITWLCMISGNNSIRLREVTSKLQHY